MSTQHDSHHHTGPAIKPWYRSPIPVAAAMIGVIVLFFLIREHWAHLAGNWAYLVLLLCPLMHLFGHGGHGGNHSASPRDRDD